MTDADEESDARGLSRRRLLALSSAGVAAVAGCGGGGDESPAASTTSTGTGTTQTTEQPTTATEQPTSTTEQTETPPETTEGPPPWSVRDGSGSHVDYDDGFADAAWFDDSVQVVTVEYASIVELKRAFEASGPRLVVFEASGVVDLRGQDLTITEDKCWVAGQTAPSPGITLVNGKLQVGADDCVVQHVRVLRGEGRSAAEGSDPMNNADGTRNVVFDHCTAYWGRDENLSVGYDSTDTTLANCLIAEGLEDPEENSNGTLVGDGAANVALLGNVWAKNNDRNPRLKDDTRTALANNFVYYFDKAAWLSPGAEAAVVGNAYAGRFDWSDAVVWGEGSAAFEDNVVSDPGLDGRPFQTVATELDERPLWPEGFAAMPAAEVEHHALSYAGARPADRIDHEARVVEEAATRALPTDVGDPANSAIPDSESEVGGYPDHGGTRRSLSVPDAGLREWVEQWALAVEEPSVDPPE